MKWNDIVTKKTPYEHPQFRRLHQLHNICTSQLWATRRSGSFLYWPQPSFTVDTVVSQNSTCEEFSKFKVNSFWAPKCHACHSSGRLKMAEACHSLQLSSSVGVLFRAKQIWCSGSKPFLTAVEDEPHELRSDKESPLAKGSCNWCHHVVNQNQIKKWSNLHCFMDPPCCFNFNKFTICTWYVMSFFICTMYNIGSWGQSKSFKLQGLRAFGPSSNSTSTLSFDEAPRTCRGLKPVPSCSILRWKKSIASPKGWLKTL